MRHSAKVAWRSLANLEKELENERDEKWYKEQYNRNREPKDQIGYDEQFGTYNKVD